MTKLFWGTVIILFDFNVGAGVGMLELLPDFVGYLLIFSGLRELVRAGGGFTAARCAALILAAVELVLFILRLRGFDVRAPKFSTVVSMLDVIGQTAVLGIFAYSLPRFEKNTGRVLYSKQPKSCWSWMTVLTFVALIFGAVGASAVLAALIQFAANCVLLVGLHRSRRSYNGK